MYCKSPKMNRLHSRKLFFFTLCFLLYIPALVYAQGEIPVNMYTGQPGININLYTLADHDLSENISLSYDVNGTNLNSGSVYGVGWSLSTGGQQISRQVRGLPDDFGNGDTRKGWLYNSNYSAVLLFPNSSDASSGTCTDEQSDQAWINNTLQSKLDTEPDLYSFSVGGYSGKFVFDNTGNIQLIPYQDISIVPTYAGSPTNMTITSWTITTNTGIVYTFGETCSKSRKITKLTNQTYMGLMDRDYNLYSTLVSFTSAWMLTKSQSPSGANLTYTYKIPPNGTISYSNPWNVELFNPGSSISSDVFALMDDSGMITSKIIAKITTSSNDSVTCDPTNGIRVYNLNHAPSNVKNFSLGYTNGMLTSITESDVNTCLKLPPYKFYYRDWSGNGQSSSSQDFWGFYNGATNMKSNGNPAYFPTIYVYPNEPASERYRMYKIPSYAGTEIVLNGDANRTPSANSILSGTLSRIIYPTGGESDFTFEVNKYFDTRTQQDQLGGGLRIQSITYFDGLNPTANITKNFTYLDASGHSSGKLIDRPSFVIPLWQQKVPTATTTKGSYTQHATLFSQLSGNAIWQSLTAVVSKDISNQDDTQGSSVGYSRVTVTRPNAGYVIFDYHAPATYGDNATGVNPTDWSPTTRKFARPSNCPIMGIISASETYAYSPFPNVEYDYERGLIWKKTEYNTNNVAVRTTTTTYQYQFNLGLTQPKPVVGLAYERFANSDDNIFLYGRYSLLTNVAKVVSTETVTTVDENNAARLSTESSQYYFGSLNHRYVSAIDRTTSDGTVFGTRFKYVPDYSTSASTDTTGQMIQALKNAKRTSTVIEQVSTIKPAGSSTVSTIGASLVKFSPFTFSKPLLRYQMAFRPASPVVDFTDSGISGNLFVNDSRYDLIQTINEYDAFDLPVSITGEDKVTTGTLWGYGQRLPVAQFSQARSTSVAFSDFETSTLSSFALTNNFYGSGRTGVQGIHPYATLTRTIVKPGNATSYLLSFWAKPQSAAASIILQVVLKNAGGTVLSTNNYTFTYQSGNTDYQYFTKVIDISTMPSTFIINLQGQSFTLPSGSAGSFSSSLLPMLDDIGFYPDYTNLASTTYNIPFGASSVTSPSGETAYTTYDVVGRTKWIIDQDHNIRKRYTYSASGQVLAPLVASLASAGTYIVNNPITFVANSNPCYSGVTFQWDFGSGYSTASSSPQSPPKTYTTVGNYTVGLKVNHPTLGSVPSAISVTIGNGLTPLNVTLDTPGVDGSGWLTLTATLSAADADNSTIVYKWYQRNTGATGWNASGGTSNTMTQKIIPNSSVEFKCVITTGDNRTATSNILTINNY